MVSVSISIFHDIIWLFIYSSHWWYGNKRMYNNLELGLERFSLILVLIV